MSDSEYDASCVERETLVAYAYGECEPWEREEVDAHVTTCASCADVLQSLGSVRGALAEWTVPDKRPGIRVVADPASVESAPVPPAESAAWSGFLAPAWRFAVAASVVLVVAAAIASVEVRYDDAGFVFRMGWMGEPASTTAATTEDAPWREELAALEQTLRTGWAARPTGDADAETMRSELVSLIEASERRQQQDFAAGLITLAQEFELQRREDQLRVRQDVETLTDYIVRVGGR